MVAFGKPTIEEWQADVLVDSLALSSDVPAGQLFSNDVDGAGQTQPRSRLLRPSAQRYSKSATATIPIVFQHGDDQIATAGGWAILSAHRQARRHAVGFGVVSRAARQRGMAA